MDEDLVERVLLPVRAVSHIGSIKALRDAMLIALPPGAAHIDLATYRDASRALRAAGFRLVQVDKN